MRKGAQMGALPNRACQQDQAQSTAVSRTESAGVKAPNEILKAPKYPDLSVRGMDSRQWVRAALIGHPEIHTGHRAMLLLILSESRNVWRSEIDRSTVAPIARWYGPLDRNIWISWYSAAQQARLLAVTERHARSLTSELREFGLIGQILRKGTSSLIFFDTRWAIPAGIHSGSTHQGFPNPTSQDAGEHCSDLPGSGVPPSPELGNRERKGEVESKYRSRKVLSDSVNSVIDDILREIKRCGRNRREEVQFYNPISTSVVAQLGWPNLCGMKEIELRHRVTSLLRRGSSGHSNIFVRPRDL